MTSRTDLRTAETAPGVGKRYLDEFSRTVYRELYKLAVARIRNMHPGETLQPTELVNEAYLGLHKSKDMGWENRVHFFGAAARAMRDVLVEHARRKSAVKRGGEMVRVEITLTLADRDKTLVAEEILTVHSVLDQLYETYPKHAEIVLLNYFAGLTMQQIAEMQGVATRTIERRWRFARAWLHARIRGR